MSHYRALDEPWAPDNNVIITPVIPGHTPGQCHHTPIIVTKRNIINSY